MLTKISVVCDKQKKMIPKETVDQIFESCKIEEVVGSYLPDLKKEERIIGHLSFS